METNASGIEPGSELAGVCAPGSGISESEQSTLQFENQINGGGWVKKATLNNSGGFEVWTASSSGCRNRICGKLDN